MALNTTTSYVSPLPVYIIYSPTNSQGKKKAIPKTPNPLSEIKATLTKNF